MTDNTPLESDPLPHGALAVRAAESVDDGAFECLSAVDTLAPGYYWRLKTDMKVEDETWKGHFKALHAGDVHLLLDIFEFEGAPHTAVILCHPRNGDRGKHKILIAEFLASFEPAPDGEQVRAAEIAAIMGEVTQVQERMIAAEANPLALPDVQEAAKEAVEKFEQELVTEQSQRKRDEQQRKTDPRKLHRRAARRSGAAGNPLVVRSTTISDNVGMMIAGGIDSEGLEELTLEARRRTAIATASAKWLQAQSKELTDTLTSVAPYYAEKGQVALARASKAIKYVRTVTEGLTSLKLYTGDGVDVVTLVEGVGAPPGEPLWLVQGKRYLDEELSVWADVSENFDWRSQPAFFEALKNNQSLLDQVFPTARCVVSAATTRRDIDYGSTTSAFERAINAIKNRSVFLLVRNGANVHVVYSSEPSHEASDRLFPTKDDVEGLFKGVDGSRIGLQDVAFSKSTEKFERLSLHYLRFLILACGLDHRMKLFGEFYPPEQAMDFMKQEFQQRYLKFLHDEENDSLIGEALLPVREWMTQCNRAVVSGSRIVMVGEDEGLLDSSPQMKRMRLEVDWARMPPALLAAREGKSHYVTVPVKRRWSDEASNSWATAWLDGAGATRNPEWFLCIDHASLATVRRYLYSRVNHAGHISWLRAFKRAEAVLATEFAEQGALRSHLRATALEHKVLTEDAVDEAIERAIITWRAARRGAAAPALDDAKSVQELLTLIYPADRLAFGAQHLLERLIAETGSPPLRLCRTGTTRLVLYVECTEQDKAPYAQGVEWGWVKRLVIDARKTKLSVASSSLAWLRKDKPAPQEEQLRTWPALERFIHEGPPPCELRDLAYTLTAVTEATAGWLSLLREGRDTPRGADLPEELFEQLLGELDSALEGVQYFQCPYVIAPLGVAQASGEQLASFVHATMPVSQFVLRYGSPAQAERLKVESRLRHFPGMKAEIYNSPGAWSLVALPSPIKRLVCLEGHGKTGVWRPPEFMSIESHERGGLSRERRKWTMGGTPQTRAQRRANNGSPWHERKSATLSFNRAFDRLMGLTPYPKREFDESRSRRVFLAGSSFDEEGRAAQAAEEARQWVRPHVWHFLSPLVWDEQKGRSIANRYLSTPEQHAEKAAGATD